MEDTSPISLRNIFNAIRTYWIVALGVAALLFVGIAAYVLALKPAYTADSLLLLSPMTEELQRNPNVSDELAMTDPMFVRSETAIVDSDDISRDVIKKLQLDKVPEFEPHPGLRDRLGLGAGSGENPYLSPEELRVDGVLRIYKGRLTVFNDGRNKTVQIGFTASDPRLAARIANAHAEAYMNRQAARRSSTQKNAIEWLKKEVDVRAKDVRDAEALVQQYQVRNGIINIKDSSVVEQRLSQLNAQLVDAQRQLSVQTAQLQGIRDIRSGDASKAAGLLASEPLNDLLRSRVAAESNVSALEKRFAPNHPSLRKAKQELGSLNSTLDIQLTRMQSEAQSSVASLRRQVADLTEATRSEASNKSNQDKVAAGLPSLMAEAQVKRTVFETVLGRYQTRLSEQAFLAPAATLVSRAEPPAEPSFPKTPLLLVIGAMIAAFGGICGALVVHLWRPTSLSLNTVADAIGIRPLVAVPRFRNAAQEDGVVRMKDPRLFIESIRSARNAIFEQRPAQETKTVLLTSVKPGQGKSLVAMSLARSLARGGARTLFMEMDLRCPNASTLARQPYPSRGTGALLEGRATLNEVITRDENTGLHMLFAEENASSSLDRLTALTFASLIAKLRNHYDAIIIDSSPVGVVSDALTIAALVDQTVIVSKDGDTSTDDLALGVRLLKDRGANVSGLVLTGVDPKELVPADKSSVRRYVVGMPARIDERLKDRSDHSTAVTAEIVRPSIPR